MQNKKELVKDLVKLQILCIRYIERHTNLRCLTSKHMWQIIMDDKLECTYEQAVKNLKKNITDYCKDNTYLVDEVLELEKRIQNSNIKNLNLNFGEQEKITEEESILNLYLLEGMLSMINDMVDIRYVVDNYGLTEGQVKQACQQERLLNTRKIGKSWMVHIPEVVNYWKLDCNGEEIF